MRTAGARQLPSAKLPGGVRNLTHRREQPWGKLFLLTFVRVWKATGCSLSTDDYDDHSDYCE